MTIAYSDLEDQLDALTRDGEPEVFTGQAPAAKVRVEIVARTWRFGTAIKVQMAQDDGVEGGLRRGTLAQILAQQGEEALDWARTDFLVFEARPDTIAQDCAALQMILAQAPHVQTLAMVRGEVTPALSAAYLAAGARDVLSSAPFERAENIVSEQADTAPALNAPPVKTMPSARLDEGERAEAVSAMLDPFDAAPNAAPDAAPDAALNAAYESAQADVSERISHQPVTESGLKFAQVTILLRARGGAGASTVATNLAISQARFGSVALVDLDLQNGSIGTLLDLPDSAAFTQLIKTRSQPDGAFLERAMVRHASGIDVLAAPDVFAPMTALTAEQVADLLEALRSRYDHVILDLPQAVMEWFAPVLDNATRALIVTDTSVPSIKRAKRLIEVMTEDHMTLPVTMVVNAEKRPLLQSAALKEAARLLDRPLNHWIPLDPAPMRRARDMGVPVILGAKRSGASRAMTALADAICKPKAKGGV